jgi:PEGA domain
MKPSQPLVILCSLLFVLLSTPLCLAAPKKKLSQQEKDTFNTAVAQATNDFKTQEFSKALENYKKAYNIDEDPALLLALGQCYRKLEKYNEAISSYKIYLEAVPNTPDRKGIEESIKTLQILLAQGSVEFSSDQDPGTRVWIDEVPFGETTDKPLIVTGIEPGERTIEARKEGFVPYKKTFKLAPGQRQIMGATLNPEPGIIEVSATLEEMGVYLDGVLVGKASPSKPLLIRTLQGKHTLLYTKKGYRDLKRDEDVLAGKTLQLAPILEAGKGSVRVKINLVEAEVLLDNKEMGKTGQDGTLFLPEVKAGPHTLQIKIPPFQTVTQDFVLNDDDTQEIIYSFSAPVTAKAFFGISGVTLLTGAVLVIATADGDDFEDNFENQPGFPLGVSLLGTGFVSGSTAVILGIRQRARNLIRQREVRQQKRGKKAPVKATGTTTKK